MVPEGKDLRARLLQEVEVDELEVVQLSSSGSPFLLASNQKR